MIDHFKGFPHTATVGRPIKIHDMTQAPALDKRDWIAGLEKGLAIIEIFDDAIPIFAF